MKILTDEKALELTELLLQNDKTIQDKLVESVNENKGKIENLENDSHKHENSEILNNITTEKVEIWDNKAEKSEIPNIEGLATETFVTTAIANAQLSGGDVDLSGYYTKDETYSKTEVDNLIPSEYDDTDVIERIENVEQSVEDIHSHENKEVLDDITAEKITEWNNKSDFDGSYNSLTDTPTNLATTEYVDNALQDVDVDLTGYATEEYVEDAVKDKADKSDIPSLDEYITSESLTTALSNYAKAEDVPDAYDDTTLVEMVEQIETDLDNKADKTELHTHDNKTVLDSITSEKVAEWDAKATETFVTNKIAEAQLTGSDIDLSGLATKDELNAKADATHNHTLSDITDYETPDLSGYALKTELPSIDGLVSEETLNTTLADYVKSDDLPNGYDDTELSNRVTVIEDDYVKQADIPTELPASDVYDWAKAENKPTYTADEVGALPDTTIIPTVTNDLTDELKADYDEAVTSSHTHDNKTVIDKLTESDEGKLLFNGEEIQGNGTQGVDGKSAYEIAQDYGFEGTEEEWLESLKGEDGAEGKSITNIEADEYNNIVVTFSDGSIKNIGQLSIDITADFLGEEGFGNLRYYDGKFQYWHTETSSWVDTSVSPDNVYLINMIPQQMKSMRGIYDFELGYNKLKFEEPSDTIIEGQSACVVKSVIIRRKLGSAPEGIEDGELVLNIKREDFYKHINTWYIDDSFTPNLGEVWYYKAFPMSTTGFTNDLSDNDLVITCKDHYLFGFTIDQNESDPTSMISYIADNKGFYSAYMNYIADKFNYGDWEEFWFIRDLKPCMLNYDGTVAYELDKNDYSLKADGTASDIANNSFAGNAMIGIPKVYWKIVDNGDNTANIYFSNKKVDDDFVCWSHIDNNGNEIDYCYMPIYNGSNVSNQLRSLSGKTHIHSQTGTTEITYALANNKTEDIIWYTEVFSDRMLINLLLLLIGKSTDTQTVFGNGHYTGGSSASNLLVTGTLNDKGLFYGTNGTGKGVKVFGMENWWGNQWRRIAGWINDKGNQKIKMTYGQSDGSTVDGYNTDGSGYISVGCTPSGTNGGYINKMTITEYGLIPTTASGSATTYYTDGLWFNNSQVDYVLVGGSSTYGLLVGAFCSNLSYLSSCAGWGVGAAVSCKPLA